MKSLRFRLMLWFSLAVTLTAGSAAWIGRTIVQRQMMEGIDFLLDAEIQEIVQRIGEAPESVTDEQLLASVESHTEIDAPTYYFQIRRLGTGIVFRSRNLGDSVLSDLGTTGSLTKTATLHDEPVREREFHYGPFSVQVATNLEQELALIDRYGRSILLGMPILFIASIAIGALLSRFALGPVRAMQRSARRITASNLSERLPVPEGRDEIAGLALLLNELFARLEASFEQVKRFTADASHELKTPLSLIRLHAERLANSPRLDPADLAQVEGQLEEISRLNRMVEQLLMLAQADAGALRLERRTQKTARFITEFGEDAAALAEERGLRFAIAANEDGEAPFDSGMIRQVLLNVLSNALRHTPPGGSIVLASRIADGEWHITLEDEGPGIAPELLERIFGRFVRGQGSGPGGSGLGLAIAKGVIEAHAGSIHAENRPRHGLRVMVRLPEAHATSRTATTVA